MNRINYGTILILSQIFVNFLNKITFKEKIISPKIEKFGKFISPYFFGISVTFIHIFLFQDFFLFLKSKKTKNIKNMLLSSFAFIVSSFLHIKQIIFGVFNQEFWAFFSIYFRKEILTILLFYFILLTVFFLVVNKIKLADSNIIKRKYFHFLIFIIYFVGIKVLPKENLKLISIVVLYLFITFEIFKNKKFLSGCLFIQDIKNFMLKYKDDRENSNFLLSHTFLLVGSFSSLFYDFNKSEYNYLGLFILGLGDSFCSIFGKKFGKHQIYPYNKKTLEGTLCGFFLTMMIFCLCFNRLINKEEFLLFALAFFYEGMTGQMDNLFLPLFINNLFCIFL